MAVVAVGVSRLWARPPWPDDYDAIVRFLKGMAEPENKAQLEAMKTHRIARAPVGLAEIREGDFVHWKYGADRGA